MTEPYLWIFESPGHFNPVDGGEPPYTDFSDVEKPGYFPLYRDDVRADLVKALTWAMKQIPGYTKRIPKQNEDWCDAYDAAKAALAKAAS